MIRSRADLHAYLEADRIALRRNGLRPALYDEVWRFQRLLRRVEYFLNCRRHRGPFGWLAHKYWSWRLHRQALRCGFEVPPNVFGPGLSIAHRGTLVVHPDVRVGRNCRIHVDVVLGTRPGPPPEAPRRMNQIHTPMSRMKGSQAIRICDSRLGSGGGSARMVTPCSSRSPTRPESPGLKVSKREPSVRSPLMV